MNFALSLALLLVSFVSLAHGLNGQTITPEDVIHAMKHMSPEQYDKVSEVAALNVRLIQYSNEGDHMAIRQACATDSLAEMVCKNRAIDWFIIADVIEQSQSPPTEASERRFFAKVRYWIKSKFNKFRDWVRSHGRSPVTRNPLMAEQVNSDRHVTKQYTAILTVYNSIASEHGLPLSGEQSDELDGTQESVGLVKRDGNFVTAFFKAIARGTGFLIGAPIGAVAFVLTVLVMTVGAVIVGAIFSVAKIAGWTIRLVDTLTLGLLKLLRITPLIRLLARVALGVVCFVVACLGFGVAGLFGAIGTLGFKMAGFRNVDINGQYVQRPVNAFNQYRPFDRFGSFNTNGHGPSIDATYH